MKINDVHITNWEAPGDKWWDDVAKRSSEPLIEATMKMTLSWEEYKALISSGRPTKFRELST